MTDLSTYMTTAQVADLLGVSPTTVRSWRQRRTGPAWSRLGPAQVVYARADVETWAGCWEKSSRPVAEDGAAAVRSPGEGAALVHGTGPVPGRDGS